MLQKKPTDQEVAKWGFRGLFDYSTKVFKGKELEDREYSSGKKTVSFYDKSVKSKIKPDKLYKCWYDYSDASDPCDTSEFWYIAYIEEVPELVQTMYDTLEKLKRQTKKYETEK